MIDSKTVEPIVAPCVGLGNRDSTAHRSQTGSVAHTASSPQRVCGSTTKIFSWQVPKGPIKRGKVVSSTNDRVDARSNISSMTKEQEQSVAADRCSSDDTRDVSVAEPQQPHDDLDFEELAQRYNYRLTSDNRRVFARLVIKQCQKLQSPVRTLDVGCGRGIGRRVEYQWAIRPHADEFWGLEPDSTREPDDELFDRHEHALMENADLPNDYFDVSYSFMVMEHVVNPEQFMQAMMDCLKPGGTYLFITPNKRHYFTRIASALHTLHLDEAVLRIIKRGSVEDYHYPVQYRFNDERRIDACARRIGFQKPEYAYVESDGPRGYFPGPLRLIYEALCLKRKIIQQPRALVSLLCRITKPL